jgi:hypothetical protein
LSLSLSRARARGQPLASPCPASLHPSGMLRVPHRCRANVKQLKRFSGRLCESQDHNLALACLQLNRFPGLIRAHLVLGRAEGVEPGSGMAVHHTP